MTQRDVVLKTSTLGGKCDCSMGVPHVYGTRLVTSGLFYVNNTDVLAEVPYL